MTTTIASFFTFNGIPKPGLSPTIRIWELSPTGDNTLIIGSTEGTGNPGTGIGTDGIMLEVFDKTVGIPGSGTLPIGGSRDGFYYFNFTTAMGYDQSKSYVIKVDGGSSQPVSERYQVSQLESKIDLVAAIYDEPATNHTAIGSFGAIINQTQANTQNLLLSMVDVSSLLSLLLKYETNRTKIDAINHTLTIFDDDCTTPLRTFKLLDSYGFPSVQDVCERQPQSTGTTDNRPTCV